MPSLYLYYENIRWADGCTENYVIKPGQVLSFPLLQMVIVLLAWVRLFCMLRLSLAAGAIVSTTVRMASELAMFLALWVFELLIGFTFIHMVIAYTVSNETAESDSFTFTRLIEIVITGKVVDNFEEHRLPMVLFTMFGVVNLVVFGNCVIAILNESYARLKNKGQAMHMLDLFEALPGLMFDPKDGRLVAAVSPFNLVNFLLQSPTLCCCKKPRCQNICTIITGIICYIPIALILTVLFCVVNIALLPFGFLYGLYSLLRCSCDSPTWYGRFEWLVFLLFGLPILTVLYFCDLFYFIKSLCYFVEAPNLQLTPRMSQDTSTKLMDAITETLLD